MNQPTNIVNLHGITSWWRGNELHREDGPAVECDGLKEWYLHGVRHRTNGPAIERFDGYKAWSLNGVDYESINDYCNALNMTIEETTIFLLKWSY